MTKLKKLIKYFVVWLESDIWLSFEIKREVEKLLDIAYEQGRKDMKEEITKQQEKNLNKKLGKISKEEQDYYNNL